MESYRGLARSSRPASVIRGFAVTITMRNERGDEETISDVITNQRDSPYIVMKAYEIKLGWKPVEVEIVEVVSAGGVKITEPGKRE